MRLNFKSKINQRLLFHWLTILIIAAIPIIYGIDYYNTDDIFRRQMVVGSVQFAVNPYLIHSPAVLGELYISLYKYFPNMEWYKIVYYVISVFFWFIIIGKAYSDKIANNFIVFSVIIAFLALIGKDALTHVHFTTVSCYFGILAAILSFEIVLGNIATRVVLKIAFSAALLFFGLCFRLESAILLFVCTWLIQLIDAWLFRTELFNSIRQFRHTLKIISLTFILPILVALVIRMAEPYEIREFQDFAKNFRKVFDYHLLTKSERSEQILQESKWDTVQLNMVKWYIIPGNDKFDLSRFRELNNSIGAVPMIQRFDSNTILNLLDKCFIGYEYHFPFFALFYLFFIFSTEYNRRLIGAVILYLILLGGVFISLHIVFKTPPEYLVYPLYLSLFIVLLLRWAQLFQKLNYVLSIGNVFMGIVCVVLVYSNQSEFLGWVDDLRYTRREIRDYSGLVEGKTLICLSQRSRDYVFPPYECHNWWKSEDLKNIIYLSPYTFHPSEKEKLLKEKGDIIRYSVDSDSIYWAYSNRYENDIEYVEPIVLDYLRNEYKCNARFESVQVRAATKNEIQLRRISTNE